jgi:hypothetical protein
MNIDTDVNGDASVSYPYPGSEQDIIISARKSKSTDDPRYKAESTVGKITASGYSLTISMTVQPIPI